MRVLCAYLSCFRLLRGISLFSFACCIWLSVFFFLVFICRAIVTKLATRHTTTILAWIDVGGLQMFVFWFPFKTSLRHTRTSLENVSFYFHRITLYTGATVVSQARRRSAFFVYTPLAGVDLRFLFGSRPSRWVFLLIRFTLLVFFEFYLSAPQWCLPATRWALVTRLV